MKFIKKHFKNLLIGALVLALVLVALFFNFQKDEFIKKVSPQALISIDYFTCEFKEQVYSAYESANQEVSLSIEESFSSPMILTYDLTDINNPKVLTIDALKAPREEPMVLLDADETSITLVAVGKDIIDFIEVHRIYHQLGVATTGRQSSMFGVTVTSSGMIGTCR